MRHGALNFSAILLLAVLLFPVRTFSDTQNSGEDIRYGETHLLRDAGHEAIQYLMAPMMVPMRLLHRRVEGKSPQEALEETAREDSKYLIGYGIIAYGTRKASQAFFEIDYEAFKAETNDRMNANPKKVLYINGIEADDRLSQYPRAYFLRQYEKHPDATFLTVESYEAMIEKLKALPQDSSFDRIEIMGHGGPGKITIGKGKAVKANDLEKLKLANLKIAAPGADLRLVSCSLAANTPLSPKGEILLTEFGDALLPNGGKAFGASKNIAAFDIPLPVRTISHAMGIGAFMDIWTQIPNLWRDYRQANHSAIEVTIPPMAPPACFPRSKNKSLESNRKREFTP